MAVTVKGSGGIAIASNTTAQFTAPAVVDADDLFVMSTSYNQPAFEPPTPTGWTAGPVITVSTSMKVKLFWKWAAGTEDGTAQGWLSGQWSTASAKGIAWISLGGVVRALWDAMSDAQRFATMFALSVSSEAVPAVSTDVGLKFTPISFWNERTSTATTAGTISPPSGYTLTPNMTYRTGGGVCQGAVAWPTSLAEETDGSVGSGSWGNASAGGISLITVAVPTGVNTQSAALTGTGTLTAVGTVPPSAGTAALSGTGSLSGSGKPAAGGSGALSGTGTLGVVAGPADLPFAYPLAFPMFADHRFGNPGPEETKAAAAASHTRDPDVALEADMQVLATGEVVLQHDDTIDRMADATSPITTGNVIDLTLTQWRTILERYNTGFSGSPLRPPGELVDLAADYGPFSAVAGNKLLLLEVKTGTVVSTCLAQLRALGLRRQTIVNCNTVGDYTAAVAAGFETCYQNDTPNFTTLAAAGVKHVSVEKSSVTSTMTTNAHAAGIRVWSYTINSTTDRDTFLGNGGDGVISNGAAALKNTAARTASLSGTGTLVASGSPAVPRTGALSGTGSLSAVGTPAAPTSGALSGTGTLTAVPTPRLVTGAALSGLGTLLAAGVPQVSRSGALSGTGTLTGSGTAGGGGSGGMYAIRGGVRKAGVLYVIRGGVRKVLTRSVIIAGAKRT
jgi:glycerophosphoryl diester phosphodiesterase